MYKWCLVCFKQQGLLWLLLGRWEACTEMEVAICRQLADVHGSASFLWPVLPEKFQIKIEISGFSWKTGSRHHIRPTLLQWGLEPSVRQDVCSLVCHTPQQYLSSSTQPTYVTSLVPVGTGACDCWICRGRIRLRGMKYKSAQGQLQMQCCMVESSWNHRSQGTWVVSPVYINTCVNSGLYGGLFPHL